MNKSISKQVNKGIKKANEQLAIDGVGIKFSEIDENSVVYIPARDLKQSAVGLKSDDRWSSEW